MGKVGDVITVREGRKNVGTTTAGKGVLALINFNNTIVSRTYGGYVTLKDSLTTGYLARLILLLKRITTKWN